MNPDDPHGAPLRRRLRALPSGIPHEAGGRGAAHRLALEADPAAYGAHLGLGYVLRAGRDVAGAREHFRRAAESPDPAVRSQAETALHAQGVSR